jgi:hypothetical protein
LQWQRRARRALVAIEPVRFSNPLKCSSLKSPVGTGFILRSTRCSRVEFLALCRLKSWNSRGIWRKFKAADARTASEYARFAGPRPASSSRSRRRSIQA